MTRFRNYFFLSPSLLFSWETLFFSRFCKLQWILYKKFSAPFFTDLKGCRTTKIGDFRGRGNTASNHFFKLQCILYEIFFRPFFAQIIPPIIKTVIKTKREIIKSKNLKLKYICKRSEVDTFSLHFDLTLPFAGYSTQPCFYFNQLSLFVHNRGPHGQISIKADFF